MTTITVPCAICSGTGWATHEDRHTETRQDQCLTCGGRRMIPARPGESRETSWPDAVPGAQQPADAVGAPPPVPTSPDVEGLVDALVTAARSDGWSGGFFADTGMESPRKGRNALTLARARTALLSRITLSPAPSDQGRGSKDVAEEASLAIIEWMMCEGLLRHRTAEDDGIKIENMILRALQSPSTGDGGGDGRRPDGHGLSPSVGLASDPAGSIPGAEKSDLWCMNVLGPDDVHAAPDFWTALAWSTEINAALGKRAVVENWSSDEHMPFVHAVPTRWPWSAELHASDLKKELAERADHDAKRRAAPGIEAGTATTEGRGAEHESPVDDANSGGEAREVGLESLADDFVLRVSEWDDRTSPEDWPEALLITRGELKCELLAFAREAASIDQVPTPAHESEGARAQTTAQILDIHRRKLARTVDCWNRVGRLDEGEISFLIRMAEGYLRPAPASPRPSQEKSEGRS